ncbi:MAG: MerR family transcriptional regulator [Propionibacteriaceae bacterium]|nr:MerR family transcriptional regulator [Propionibacteriaceae bacterium]
MPPSQLRSIGDVLPILKTEFPDLSISKIRFLEGEGLVAPERAPSGYRRYSDEDVERLRYILRMQRDYYMPLKKIRERLDLVDLGIEPPAQEIPEMPVTTIATSKPRQDIEEEDHTKPFKLTRRELIRKSGISEATLVELERQQMVLPRRGTLQYGSEALMICVVARKMQAYGMDTRHLRAIKQSAEREAGMVEQAIMPLRRHPQVAENLQEATQLVLQAHAALMYVILHH